MPGDNVQNVYQGQGNNTPFIPTWMLQNDFQENFGIVVATTLAAKMGELCETAHGLKDGQLVIRQENIWELVETCIRADRENREDKITMELAKGYFPEARHQEESIDGQNTFCKICSAKMNFGEPVERRGHEKWCPVLIADNILKRGSL